MILLNFDTHDIDLRDVQENENASETPIKMENISLRKATIEDKEMVVAIDYRLNKIEHVELKRAEKITKSISANECYIILGNNCVVGFILFDYRFFDQGWIELIVVDEKYKGQGIGPQALKLICGHCKMKKVFTSTNQSNHPMQKALSKAGFSFAGKIVGLDDGDPELFYYKEIG